MEQKRSKNSLMFLIVQFFLFAFLLFIIISVSLNISYIIKLDNFVFSLADKIRNKFTNNLFFIFTLLGESYVLITIFIILFFTKKRKQTFPLLCVTSLSTVINYCLKNLIAKARPIGQFVNNLIFNYEFPKSFSFPSGHSQTPFVFYFLLVYILLENYKGKHKNLFLLLTTLFSIIIMLSRIIIGVHYFSDVLAGAIIGVILITNFIHFKKIANCFN